MVAQAAIFVFRERSVSLRIGLTCVTALGFTKHTILPIGFSIAYVVFAIIACMHCFATDEIDRGILRQVSVVYSMLSLLKTLSTWVH